MKVVSSNSPYLIFVIVPQNEKYGDDFVMVIRFDLIKMKVDEFINGQLKYNTSNNSNIYADYMIHIYLS